MIEFCKQIQCTVIALSATISDSLKAQFFNTSTFGKEYPMITYLNKDKIIEYPIVDNNPIKSRFKINISYDQDLNIDEAIQKAFNGDQIVWVENTVEKAQKIYSKISNKLNGKDIDVILIHSKFTFFDRLNQQRSILEILNKKNKQNKNSIRYKKGRIVVSTQVIEQSLDIDFDYQYTRICPIDSLGQRLGRVGRFDYSGEEKSITIVSDYSINDYRTKSNINWFCSKNNSEFSFFVYDAIILYRTLDYFSNHPHITYPDDYRNQLNYVYDNIKKIDGFDKYNEYVDKYYNDMLVQEKQANINMICFGETKNNVDVKTRNVTNEDFKCLLIRKIKGDVYYLMSGQMIDFSNQLTIDDQIKINNNICKFNKKFLKTDLSYIVPNCLRFFQDNQIIDVLCLVNEDDSVDVIDSSLSKIVTKCWYNKKIGFFK